MKYRNEDYFRRLKSRKRLTYSLAGLAGLTALLSVAEVGNSIYEKARAERPSLERTVTAPENPKSKEDEDYDLPRLNPKIVPIESKDKIIVLDAGHGMSNRTDKVYDPGAVSGDYKEAEIVLSQAEKVKELLEAKGYTVFLTRTDAQTSTPLGNRTKVASDKNADILVSLHYNASDSADANGTEVLYNGEQGKALAQYIHDAVVKALGTKDRGIVERTDLRVLKAGIPSALVETAFISNSGDRQKASGYADEQAIADGIDAYFNAGAK